MHYTYSICSFFCMVSHLINSILSQLFQKSQRSKCFHPEHLLRSTTQPINDRFGCYEFRGGKKNNPATIQRHAPAYAHPKSQTFTWHLHTKSASVANKSTTFPLPSSPHCAPSTTVTLFPTSLRDRFCPTAAGWFWFLWSLADQVSDMMAVAVV